MSRYKASHVFLLLADDATTDQSINQLNSSGAYSAFIRRLAPSSKMTMLYSLRRIASLFGADNTPLDQIAWHKIRASHVKELINYMLESGYSASTCSKYLYALRGVLTESCQLGLTQVTDLLEIAKIRVSFQNDRRPLRLIAPGALSTLLSTCESDWRYQGVRDSAIIALLYGCGFQRKEVSAVRMEDLDQQEWSITTYGVHGSRSIRWLSAAVVRRIQAWVLIRDLFLPQTGPLFTRIRKGSKVNLDLNADIDSFPLGITPGNITADPLTTHAINYILAGRSALCGISVSPHDLRATFINRMIVKHGPKMAQRLANHELIETTLLYDTTSHDDS